MRKFLIWAFIERDLAAVTAAPWISGSSCVEASLVSVRSLVCAHFVSDNFWQILADSWQILADFSHYGDQDLQSLNNKNDAKMRKIHET